MKLISIIALLCNLSCTIASGQTNECASKILSGKYAHLLGKCLDYQYNFSGYYAITQKSFDNLSAEETSKLIKTKDWAVRLCKFHAETPIGYYDAEKHLVPDSAFQNEVILCHFKKGDVIADIGAGSAYFERAISKYSDYLTVYVTEIDSSKVSQMEPKFLLLDSTDNKSIIFKPTLGTETTTGLPVGIFDKVLIRNTFHHFSKPDEMLQQIKPSLKKGGKLIIVDILSDEAVKTPACGHHLTREVFLKYMSTNGFVLVKETTLQYDGFKLFEFKIAP
jgi:SAM-dependent methyltransferase